MDANKEETSNEIPAFEHVYISPAWHQHLDLLAHLCYYSPNCLFVLGESGSGKTTLLTEFLHKKTPGLKKIGFQGAKDWTVDSLMETLSQKLSLPTQKNPLDLSKAFHEKLEILDPEHTSITVICVDDAHLLHDDVVQGLLQLSHFDSEPKRQVHLIFMGEPDMERRLIEPQFRCRLQGKLHTMEIEPWTCKDIAHFIAGASDPSLSPLDTKQIKQLLDKTQGCVGKIKGSLKEMVKQKHSTPKSRFSLQKILTNPVMVGAYAGLALGVVFLVFSVGDEEEWMSEPTNSAQWGDQSLFPQTSPANPTSEPLALNDEAEPISPSKASQPSETLALQDAVIEPVLESPQNATVTLKQTAEPSLLEVKPEKAPGFAQVSDVPATPPAHVIAAIAPKALEKKSQVIDSVDKLALKPKTKPITAQTPLDFHEETILAASQSAYTLQVLGGRSQANIQAFIQKNNLEEKAYYFRTARNGKPWYVLVYGVYDSLEQAKTAKNSFPIKQTRPWIRPLKGIQQAIIEAKKQDNLQGDPQDT